MSLFEICFKIGLIAALSGIIGVERGIRHKGAGLRTHLLVGVGSTLIVLTSLHLFEVLKSETIVDPTRMIAGVITGIGFLCAGTIIQAGPNVKGLTTAASLWIVSCLGIAVGSGQYAGAIIVAILIFAVLTRARTIQKYLEKKIKNTSEEGE